MMQPGSRVPGLLPPASPRHYRSVCLPIYMFICLPAYLSVCLAVNQSRLMPPSACLSTALSVCPSLLPICPPVRLSVYPSICLSVCLPISLPAYVSVRPSAYLSMLSVCLSTREMGHTGHTIQRCRTETGTTVPRAARCVAECGCTRDDRVMNLFINRKVIQ